MQLAPERLAPCYLGARFDLQGDSHTSIPLNYDAGGMTTRAVCVGSVT